MADWVPGVDISNYQTLTPARAKALADDGIQVVIVRASHERQNLVTTARQQMQMVVEAGMRLHAYGWCYFTEDPVSTADYWRDLYEDRPIEHWWLDCEETQYVGTPDHNVAWLLQVVSNLQQQWPVGIYTGHWWWPQYMGDTPLFSPRPLWDADYTGEPSLVVRQPYGGWTHRAIHQYSGHGSAAGLGLLDFDALDPALLEEAEDMGQIEDLTNKLGYLQGDVADALERGLDGAVNATTKAARKDAYDAIAAAIHSLRAT